MTKNNNQFSPRLMAGQRVPTSAESSGESYQQEKRLGALYVEFQATFLHRLKWEITYIHAILSQVNETIETLREIGLTSDEVAQVIRRFPEVLGLDIETRIRANLKKLEKDFFIKGKALPKVILRTPNILGYTLDCSGDCISECDKCKKRRVRRKCECIAVVNNDTEGFSFLILEIYLIQAGCDFETTESGAISQYFYNFQKRYSPKYVCGRERETV